MTRTVKPGDKLRVTIDDLHDSRWIDGDIVTVHEIDTKSSAGDQIKCYRGKAHYWFMVSDIGAGLEFFDGDASDDHIPASGDGPIALVSSFLNDETGQPQARGVDRRDFYIAQAMSALIQNGHTFSDTVSELSVSLGEATMRRADK